MKKTFKIIAMLFFVTCITSCYEKQEGCFEFWATNYDVFADVPCADCCVEPTFTLSLSYLMPDSSAYSMGDTLQLSDGSYIRLIESHMFIHDIELKFVEDLITLTPDSTTFRDEKISRSFKYLSNRGSLGLGSYVDQLESLDTISFLYGLPTIYRDTSIIGADNVEVASAVDVLYQEQLDVFSNYSIKIALDTINIDTIIAYTTKMDPRKIAVNLDPIFNVEVGANSNVELGIEVLNWLDGVDYSQAPSTIADTLATRLENRLRYISN